MRTCTPASSLCADIRSEVSAGLDRYRPLGARCWSATSCWPAAGEKTRRRWREAHLPAASSGLRRSTPSAYQPLLARIQGKKIVGFQPRSRISLVCLSRRQWIAIRISSGAERILKKSGLVLFTRANTIAVLRRPAVGAAKPTPPRGGSRRKISRSDGRRPLKFSNSK